MSNIEIKIKKILSIFLMIQPFFDIYWLYHMENISGLFSFSPSTIIRLVVFAVLFVLFLLDKKKWKTTIAFGVVCLIYFAFHHYVALNSVFYKNETYSLISELFYIMRIAIPLYLIYVVSHYKFDDKLVEKTIFVTCLIFVFIMLITNLLGIALPAYPEVTKIKGNIFYWFIARFIGLNSYDIASKGFFNLTNQISGTFIILFPIAVYYLYKNYSNKKLLIIIGMIISMYMVGTRVAGYGAIMTLIILLIVYLVTNFKKWNQSLIYINLLLIVFSCLFIYFAPLSIREFYDKRSDTAFNTGTNENNVKLLYEQLINYIKNYENVDKREFDHFIMKYNDQMLIPAQYFDIYKIEDDKEFWINYINTRTATDNRYIEGRLFSHLDSIYGNNKTKLFGHSYSKTFNNSFYLEKDFIFQYYALGIVGVLIFFVPYIGIVVYAGIKVLFNKNKFNMKNITFIYAIALLLCSSLLSGNVMDTFIDTIFLGFVSGLLLNSVNSKVA